MIPKSFILSFVVFLLCCTGKLNGQYISRDNHSGYWTDTSCWVDSIYPGVSVKRGNIDCFGWLTSVNCLDVNLGIVTIHDTLVINGNLQLLNNATLFVDSAAILLIFGDLEINNQTIIENQGQILVAGNFRILGSDNVGSFTTAGAELYLFDKTPEMPNQTNYSDLACTDNTKYPELCGYGNPEDLKKSSLYTFYKSLPFSKQVIDTTENPCFSYDILKNNNLLCIDEPVTFLLVTVGINPHDSVSWFFGKDANPSLAYGFGPVKVSYSTSGKKDILIDIISDTTLSLIKSGLIVVQDYPATGKITNELSATDYFPYLDEVCEGDSRIYTVDSNAQSIYEWIVSALQIDTSGNHRLKLDWNVTPGEYQVSVREISSAGCLGPLSEGLVLVKECVVENLNTLEHYTFSPNGDGINDTWVIDNIENYPDARIMVFQRDGRIVFESKHNYMNDWDGSFNGKRLPLDSYYFILDLKQYDKGIINGIVTILPIDLVY